MADPVSSSARSTQSLKLIEENPLNPASWEELVKKVRGQNDPLSIKSLEIIIEGLKRIEELNLLAAEMGQTAPRMSSLAQSMFVRLGKAYNSPTLLKEVGLIYLRDLGLPNVALQHFERSMRLGGPEKELRPLSEAAAVAVQKQLALLSGQGAGHSGITTAQHARPVAPNIIRKTGKLLMPTRITMTTASKPAIPASELENEAEPSLPATTPECLAAADEAIKKGLLDQAETLLKKANQAPAGSAEMWQAWTNLGQAYYEAGLPTGVEAAFFEAEKYDSAEMASQFNLALGYHLNDKFDLALATYLKANEIAGNHPKVWCNLGVLYFQMDQYANAESALRNATRINPDYARAWDNLAAGLGAQDKLDESLAASKRAVELRPDYPEAYFKMGVIYFSRNELARATEEFKRAVHLPALTAYCECFQAMILARLEQTEAAEAAVLRAVKADPKCDLLWMAWNDLGQTYYASGNYQRATSAYGEATMIKPDEPEAWFNLGVTYHQGGDLKAARDAYQQAVDLRESLVGAWHNLGIICAQTGDLQAAMSAFRQEVHWAPNNLRAWYDLGVTLEKLGQKDDAAIAFAKVDALSQTVSMPEPVPKIKTGPLLNSPTDTVPMRPKPSA